jgi:hypothetical protein
MIGALAKTDTRRPRVMIIDSKIILTLDILSNGSDIINQQLVGGSPITPERHKSGPIMGIMR